MLNATLLSQDGRIQQICAHRLAQQLLHLGLVQIVKFYPLMVQFKGSDSAPGTTVTATNTPKFPWGLVKKNSLPAILEKINE